MHLSSPYFNTIPASWPRAPALYVVPAVPLGSSAAGCGAARPHGAEQHCCADVPACTRLESISELQHLLQLRLSICFLLLMKTQQPGCTGFEPEQDFFFPLSAPLYKKLGVKAQLSSKITEDKVLRVIRLAPFRLTAPGIGA